eukprot:533659_1
MAPYSIHFHVISLIMMEAGEPGCIATEEYTQIISSFVNNFCVYNGSGVYIVDSDIQLNATKFLSNNASSFGAGLYSKVCVESNFNNVMFAENNAGFGGGAIYNDIKEECQANRTVIICGDKGIICAQDNTAAYGSLSASGPKSIKTILQNHSKIVSSSRILYAYGIDILLHDQYNNKVKK